MKALLIAAAFAYFALMLLLPLGHGARRGSRSKDRGLAGRGERAGRALGDQAYPDGRRALPFR